jgi:hypothetical protein
MEVGVGIIVSANRAEVTEGICGRRPVSDGIALSADCELLFI